MTESRALTLKTLTSAGRNLILLSGRPPPSIMTLRPPLLIVSVLALINEYPPRLNLLTMCNTARAANSRHCPDLLYTSGGSAGLLGCSLTVCHPAILLLLPSASATSISALRPPFTPSFCHLSLPLQLFLDLLGWTSGEINRTRENRSKLFELAGSQM